MSEFSTLPLEDAIKLIQNIFEDSHWVVQRGLSARRDFDTVESLFEYLLQIFMGASDEEKLAVLRAHPDLVGKAALAGVLPLLIFLRRIELCSFFISLFSYVS